MSKIKPLRRLYFQFGNLLEDTKLSADEIAEALYGAELIEFVSEQGEMPTHYRETFGPRLSALALLSTVQDVLVEYCKARGFPAARRDLGTQERPEAPASDATEVVNAINRGDK